MLTIATENNPSKLFYYLSHISIKFDNNKRENQK